MPDTVSAYHAGHGAARYGLDRLKELQSEPEANRDLSQLAAELGYPAAAMRGAQSFYSDLHSPASAARVCVGTSCHLAGSDAILATLAESGPCREVHCLGYCHASPAVLLPGLPLGSQPVSDGNEVRFLPQGNPRVRCVDCQPILTKRLLHGDHADLATAKTAGVYAGLVEALRMAPGEVLQALEYAGLRGRGGAAFPTGQKWRHCAGTLADERYVIANGDEGDPGSFSDKLLMEQDPHAILEGMAIAGWAVGAHRGIVFIRSEYPAAANAMRLAMVQARLAGVLGERVCGSSFSFEVELFTGLGSYVCGEETALLNAIEGVRGEVRLRPPYPTQAGLYGKPTVIDNVETLANVSWIVTQGAEAFRRQGTQESPGTKLISLNYGFRQPGVVEVPFGMTLRRVIEEIGGSRGLEAVLLGGPMGSVVFPEMWEQPLCYTALAAQGVRLGHAGFVAATHGTDWRALLLHWLRFMQSESCGKCVPCRVGSQRALEMAERGVYAGSDFARLLDIIETGSLCAFGKLIPGTIRAIAKHVQQAGQERGP